MTATERAPQQQVQRTDVDAAFRGSATYRSLGEQELSPAEERFEKGRRTVGLFLAPVVTIVFALLPIDLPRDQHLLAAILLGVIVLWITEPVPIPIGGLIGVAAIVVLGVVPSDDALAPFGSPTIFTFIGAFILAMAMLKHGLARRFAMFVLSRSGWAPRRTGWSSPSARSPACCRRSSPTPPPSRCCCPPRSASSR